MIAHADFDALRAFLLRREYGEVLFFVDNAGSDLVLGALPLARYLARSARRVILAANSGPALNDITYDELLDVLDRAAAVDAELAERLKAGAIRAVPSGCHTPLIDLRTLTPACAEAARTADFLILEGMGRAIETNWHVAFTVPVLKIALIKDAHTAHLLNARLFDPVCRFEA